MISRQVSLRQLAIVTGAAGGLGSAFARELAGRGYDLLLVDCRGQPLEELCQAIQTTHGVMVEAKEVDFSSRQQLELLATHIRSLPAVDLLVNNAGFGTLSHFVDTDPSLILGMVDVHVIAPMILTHAALPRMLQRNAGGVINVSSVSAWFHSAGNTHYGSTKICLAVFTKALHEELRGTNVCVQALCPGFVRTQFHQSDSMRRYSRFLPSSKMWASAENVVAFSLRALTRKHCVVIPGYGYRIIGRLAQMPILQPLMRRITHVPRIVTATPTDGVVLMQEHTKRADQKEKNQRAISTR